MLPKKHIVDRYFSKLEQIGVFNDKLGLDYFIKKSYLNHFDVSKKYIAWCIGASYQNKKLSHQQITYVCNKLDIPIVLLGDNNDSDLANLILSNTDNDNVSSFCGDLSINESSYLIKNSSLVLTNDTGLMHISAAFNKKIISFWGCTKPILGFSPLVSDKYSIKITSNNNRPCSKHGKTCRITKNGCIKSIDPEIILRNTQKLLAK